MSKTYNKIYRVYIFDKNFKIRNAGGYPPDYMFSGKNPIGKRYDVYGNSEKDVLEYITDSDLISDEDRKTCYIMAKFLRDIPERVIKE